MQHFLHDIPFLSKVGGTTVILNFKGTQDWWWSTKSE